MYLAGNSEDFDSVTNNPGGKPSGKNPGQFLQALVNPGGIGESNVGSWMADQRDEKLLGLNPFYETRFPSTSSFIEVDNVNSFGDFLISSAVGSGFDPGNGSAFGGLV